MFQEKSHHKVFFWHNSQPIKHQSIKWNKFSSSFQLITFTLHWPNKVLKWFSFSLAFFKRYFTGRPGVLILRNRKPDGYRTQKFSSFDKKTSISLSLCAYIVTKFPPFINITLTLKVNPSLFLHAKVLKQYNLCIWLIK